MRLVHGVGINDKKSHWNTKEYFLWSNMIQRCYSKPYHSKRPTYIGCMVSENFKYFSYFYDWCQDQIGFDVEGFALDKDILIKNNKIYSENSCVFIPAEVNSLLIRCDGARGVYPIGVSYHKRIGKFQSRVRVNSDRKHLGYFDNPVDAFLAYKEEKEKNIKIVAGKYKSEIDPRAYEALMQYAVEITD